MSNVNHDQLAGSDLHDNKVYPATSTTLPSWAQTDGRYARLQRLIGTSGPLTGGGNLSTDLTIGIAAANGTTDGYLSHTDWALFAGKQAALGYAPVNRAGDTMTGNLIAALYDNGGQLYSAKVYGTIGDGVTDDTNAIKATIAAIGSAGGILFLPVGTYFVTSAIPLPANITVVGAGIGNTRITTTMTASNLRGVFTIANKNNVTIQGIGFVVNGGSTAITSYGHDHLTLRDCAFTGTTTTSNGGIVELCGQSSVGGIASMTDTLIDHCQFYDIVGSNARTIHLYPRDGHIVDRVTGVHSTFKNVGGPAVQLDAYDTCRGVRVLANDF